MQIQIVSTCLPKKNRKILSLICRAQHHIRGGNPTTLSFKGIAGTSPWQITAIMCHVKFDKYEKLGGRIYATPRCVAEKCAKLLKSHAKLHRWVGRV